jgi:hypothetical protein
MLTHLDPQDRKNGKAAKKLRQPSPQTGLDSLGSSLGAAQMADVTLGSH